MRLHGIARSARMGWSCRCGGSLREAAPDADPGAAIVAGDATWDCEAARNAGMTPVAVRCGGFGREELEAAGAAAVFETLAEVREALAALDVTPDPAPDRFPRARAAGRVQPSGGRSRAPQPGAHCA